jgi:hypothetical protein
VDGQTGIPVTIESTDPRWNWQATGYTGTKPEYGPDALEFAPLPPIRYILMVPDLQARFEFELAPNTVTEIIFEQTGPPTPTATLTPTPSPPPGATPTPTWHVRVPLNTTVPGNWFAVIRVSVEGRLGMPVRITIVDEDEEEPWSVTCLTGTKPEYGPYFCEFSPLIPAEYIISPEGLDIATNVVVKRGGVAVVIFEEY